MDPGGLVITLLLAAGVGAGAFLFGRSVAARGVNARVEVEPHSPRLGEFVTVGIHTQPTTDVQVDAIQVTLSCQRRFLENPYGEDTSSALLMSLLSTRRYRHRHQRIEYDTLVREVTTLPVGRQLRAGTPESFACEVQICPDGVPTDREGNLTVRWVLEVRFAIPRFPDAVLTREVHVRSRY
ncbi:MAG: hypothetical protein AB1758_14595 [Candidatus Eremiobacterota bacterium]